MKTLNPARAPTRRQLKQIDKQTKGWPPPTRSEISRAVRQFLRRHPEKREFFHLHR